MIANVKEINNNNNNNNKIKKTFVNFFKQAFEI